MKIVKPKVEVMFHLPEVDGKPMDPVEFLELAGRTCYKSEDRMTPGSAVKFVRMIEERGHHSVLEHCVATARFVCNRGVTHELVRHRIASYSQESTRYCNYSKDKHENQISLIPMRGGLTDEQWERRLGLYKHVEEVYLAETSEGVKAQQARDNLPICLKTEIVATFNLREWMHVFTLRCSKAAHPQIREVMLVALSVFATRLPAIFEPIKDKLMAGSNPGT